MSIVSDKRRISRCGVLLGLALSVLAIAPVRAIELDRLNSQLTYRSWTSQNGLPSDAVWDVHAADDGYLWLATEGGLVRFDGFKFDVFNSRTHDAFSVDDTRRIAAGPDGSLWISTYGGGVVHMSGNSFRRYDADDGIDNPVLYSVYVARDGSVWVGTATSVCQLRGERFECFGEDDGLEIKRVFDIGQSSDGTMWFGSLASGVSSFDGRRFTNYLSDPHIGNQAVFVVDPDPVFDVIFGTYLGDFFTFNGDGFERMDFAGLPAGMIPTEYHRDRQNNVWVGSNTHALLRVLPEYRDFLDKLRDLHVFGIAEDSQGSLWLGTTEGLHAIAAPALVPWGAPEGLDDDTFVLAEAPDGSMWTGTESEGLYRLGIDGVVEHYTEEDGVPASSVSALMIEADGLVWAGTFSSGMAWLRDGKVIGTFGEADGLASNQIAAIFRDSKGVVWIGTAKGLHRFADGKITHLLTNEDGLKADFVRYISEAADDRLLLSTDSGLVILDSERIAVIEVLSRSDGLGSDVVATTYVDEQGVVWIGGRNGGLTRLENGKAFNYSPDKQLGIDSIMGIVEDAAGYLWLGGRNGLSRVSRDQLDAVAAGTAARVEARHFSFTDGLRVLRIPGGYQAPMVRARDGRVWMATTAGLAVVDPAKLLPRVNAHKVMFDQVVADGKPLAMGPETIIPAGTQAIQLSYSTPSLKDGDALRFRYRLRGVDGRWQDAGIRRTAFYTSLPPREYVLEVQATLDGLPFGASGENTGTLQFSVAPLWYQTNLAQLAKWLGSLALAGLLYQYLVLSYRRREQRLELIVAERTGALTAALNEVRRLSQTDSLTQVANRRHFDERLREIWAAAQENQDPVSVMIVDIDHFKAFNDSAGHQAGDQALQTVAQALAAHIRQEDFLARYGGEEFIVLLAGTDVDAARQVAQRVQQQIRDLALHHPGLADEQTLTVSAGFATAKPGQIDNVEALIRRADEALYKAKAEGRDRLVSDAR